MASESKALQDIIHPELSQLQLKSHKDRGSRVMVCNGEGRTRYSQYYTSRNGRTLDDVCYFLMSGDIIYCSDADKMLEIYNKENPEKKEFDMEVLNYCRSRIYDDIAKVMASVVRKVTATPGVYCRSSDTDEYQIKPSWKDVFGNDYVMFTKWGFDREGNLVDCGPTKILLRSIAETSLTIRSDKEVYEPYHPDTPPDGDPRFFNVFPGFQARLFEPELLAKVMVDRPCSVALDIWNAHVFIVLANRDVEQARFIHSFFAYPLIKLGKYPVFPIFAGPEGSGKSLALKVISRFVHGDNNSFSYNELSEMAGDFNGELARKTFVCCEEIVKIKDGGQKVNMRTIFERMKNLVSSDNPSIHTKNKTRKQEPCIAMMCACTNFVDTLCIPGEEDSRGASSSSKSDIGRRWAPIKGSGEKVGDSAYHKVFVDALMNQSFGDLLYSYYRSDYFLNNVYMEPKPIDSEYRRECMSRVPATSSNFTELLGKGEYYIPSSSVVSRASPDTNEDILCITTAKIYELYSEWFTSSHIGKTPAGAISLGKSISAMTPRIFGDKTIPAKLDGKMVRYHVFSEAGLRLKLLNCVEGEESSDFILASDWLKSNPPKK